MKMIDSIKKLLESAKLTDSYWIEKAKLDFSVALENRRRANGLSYKDVAIKIGTSQPYVTKVFRGDANLTIETMVKLARATGGQLELHIAEANAPRAAWNIRDIHQSHRPLPTGASETVIYVDFAANGKRWNEQEKLAA